MENKQEASVVEFERKNLVTCKPSEFLRQTNKIRKSVEKWLKLTDIMNIRRRKVEGLEEISEDMPDNKVNEIRTRNMKKISEQTRQNLNDIFTAILEDYPDETLELLALMCFIEPEDVDNYKVSFYLNNLSDILSDKDVLGFFTSLVQLEQTGILNA